MNTLPNRIHDSKNGLDYPLVGDYYLPDLEIESSQPLGKYGRARMKYLKEHRPGLYSRLLLSGKLYDDLREVDAEAQYLLDEMIPQMAAEAGVNEDLKAADPIRWVGMLDILKDNTPFVDLGSEYYNQFNKERKINVYLNKLKALGWESDTAAVSLPT